ncbi:MAG: hypothetical protein AAF570_28670, partial [Bacteroidota bacterium]
ITHYQREGENLQMRIELPELAKKRNPEFTFFYTALTHCREFSLQPFRNESTVIQDLVQIARLGLTIHSAEAMAGGKVKVFCGHRGADSGARLTIRAAAFAVWDEEFDALSAAELQLLRQSGAEAED